MKNSLALAFATALVITASLRAAEPPKEVRLPGNPTSAIAAGVALPAGRALFWTSGTTPSVIKKDGATTLERYGDTYTQGVSCLKNISLVLAAQGLALKDVVYLRVYVAPDAAKGNRPDYDGWFKAYGESFNTPQNPVKTARSTVGIQSLVNPDLLIEIEAFAAYPAEAAKP